MPTLPYPATCVSAAARPRDQGFDGMKGVEGTRFYSEIERLGQFIVDYVVSGELDRIYAE